MNTAIADEDKPRNGLSGLKKHWRHDLLAGFVVSLVSLPLSSGIAIASGAPPIYGIISSVIAGLIFPFIGGSYVTISGPAAGLAPALLATMAALGGAGDADTVGAGYAKLLVVIFIVGVLQVVLSRLKVARFAAIFPASVVEGMLGAIGLLILVKALPLFFGYLEPVHAHGFFEYVREIPTWAAAGHGGATAIGAAALVVMLLSTYALAPRFRIFKVVPPHIFAVVLGVAMAAGLGLGASTPALLISVPANPLSGIQLPDFAGVLAAPDLWWAVAVGVTTLTLVDGVESLATAQAIDRIDPFERHSDPNRLLAAMGISNLLSSLVGGLTIIPGGVKSKTCIEAGGRTLWANFANAVFLLGFLFIAPALMSAIPKAALGAILVYTGWKMINPSIMGHVAHIGREQIGVYLATIAAILATDLLVGVLIGTGIKLALVAYTAWRAERPEEHEAGLTHVLADLFRDPVSHVEERDGERVVHIARPLVSFNAYLLHERLYRLMGEEGRVTFQVDPSVTLVDHTACESLLGAVHHDRTERICVRGLDALKPRSEEETAFRVRPRQAA
jgi:MFS superfamily sulfate permease-like transporter